MPSFQRRTLSIAARDGVGEVALIDIGDPARPVDVVFAHANGFTAGAYAGILAPLGENMRIVAYDQRGHGRTRLPTVTEGRNDWFDMRDDLIAVLDALDVFAPVVLAGHSLGGTAGLLAADVVPDRVSRLALFEPVIPETPSRADRPLPPNLKAFVEMTLKRRATFASREEALLAYTGRGAFRTWPRETIEAYLEDGLLEQPDGTLRLACAPAWEASNYASQNHPAMRLLLEARHPTRILRAEHHSTCRIDEADARVQANPRLDIKTIAGTTHFLPMERPELVRQTLTELTR